MMPVPRRARTTDDDTLPGSKGKLALTPDRKRARVVGRPRRGTRGRLSTDTGDFLSIVGGPTTIVAPEDHDLNWQVVEVHRDVLSSYSPSQLLDILIDVSPQLSRAVWDFLLFCDPGHEIVALKVGSDTPDERAQVALDLFLSHLKGLYGSLKVLTARLFMGAFVGGAFVAELVLDQSGRRPIDLAIPDPMGMRFKKRRDPDRGDVWDIGQWQGHQFVSFADRPTIRYIPIHPKPGKPYGRPPALPALFPCLFLLGVMYDLRRVIANQGYPKMDISLGIEKLWFAFEKLQASGGTDLSFDSYVDDSIDDVVTTYHDVLPTDAWAHTDESTLNRGPSALDSQAIASADTLIKSLERFAVQAAKSIPLLFGMTDGMSEANANRSYESHIASIKSVQHLAESLLGELFGLALEAQGIAADVVVTFAELRAAEMLRDAQTDQLRAAVAQQRTDLGYQTFEEAATYALGHPPSDDAVKAHEEAEEKAEEIAATLPTVDDETNPDEGDVSEDEPNGDNIDRSNPAWLETAVRLATQRVTT